MMKKYITALLLLFAHDLPTALASNTCLSHIQRVERQEGIPKNLLVAMAQVESGRYNKAKNAVEPWPWTVQSQGKSNYFDTKSEAVEHVKALQRKGIKNIDVGCMQMNIEHHGHKFSTIEDMFEPSHNVGQGAKYLKQLKLDKNKAWSTAVGNYHSFTPEHHTRYKNLVLKKLSIVNRGGGQEQLHDGVIRSTGFPLMPGMSNPYPRARSSAPGSLYPVASRSDRNGPVTASLYSYSRVHGMTGAKRPVHKQTHKIIKVTSKNRTATMKSRGVTDLAFMDSKKTG